MRGIDSHNLRILFIRRDNIGDLICTTPAIRAVRERFPQAKIGILVNSYNAGAIINNPDVDEIYIYDKAKHFPDRSKLSVAWSNLRVMGRIRRERYDVAVACGSYSPSLERYTFMTGAKRRIGYRGKDASAGRLYSEAIAIPDNVSHEVDRTFHLLSLLGIDSPPPPLRLVPPETELRQARELLRQSAVDTSVPLVAFHISSRRPENRWPVDHFVVLARLLTQAYRVNIMLLWSPGSEHDVRHPGDDEKARMIGDALVPRPFAFRTNGLDELVAALSLCSLVVCCDGGAMHIAAALGKSIVTIWGSTDQRLWAPWGVKHVILQDASKDAANVTVEDVFKALGPFLEQ